MTQTQIQLPDDVYARAQQVCQEREITMAELARRGLEQILSVYAAPLAQCQDWRPPEPQDLGWNGLNDDELKEAAQTPDDEENVR